MLASASPRKPRLATRSRSSRRGDLAGGMARQGQRQLVAGDAAAVVGDLEQLGAAGGQLHLDGARAGVEAVLQQLLERGGGPLDHLASGDLVDEQVGEWTDGGHAQRRRIISRAPALVDATSRAGRRRCASPIIRRCYMHAGRWRSADRDSGRDPARRDTGRRDARDRQEAGGRRASQGRGAERGAGVSASVPDQQYVDAGATIVASAAELYGAVGHRAQGARAAARRGRRR